MSIFPKIQGPCPYKSELSKYMEGDLCRMCDRRVVDLNPLSDTERVELISGCKDKVCVSYTIRPSAAVALAAAAVLIPLSVAAQDVAVEEEYMIVGAIVEPTDVEYYAHADAVALAEMPVIYDDEPTTPALDEVTSIPTNQTANPQRSNE
ncbi:MAG: hypothetical protein ABL932_14940 [Terricaulis sp.]